MLNDTKHDEVTVTGNPNCAFLDRVTLLLGATYAAGYTLETNVPLRVYPQCT
jgi:hypothetical protein